MAYMYNVHCKYICLCLGPQRSIPLCCIFLLNIESLNGTAFVKWIVYSIESCLVVLIISIYFVVLIKNMLVEGILIPWFRFHVRINTIFIQDYLASLWCTEDVFKHSGKIGISETSYSSVGLVADTELSTCPSSFFPGVAYQRKYIYIEHRAGKAARLASWRKMTQPGEFCWWW